MGWIMSQLQQDLKILAASLAGIVIDTELPVEIALVTLSQPPAKREVSKLHGLGLDAMEGLIGVYGELSVEPCQHAVVTQYQAWFGDYEPEAKIGSGRTKQEAFVDLLERYA